MKQLNFLDWATLALAVSLLGCLGHWPYDYYMLVRTASMVIFGAQAVRYFKAEREPVAYMFAALALLFQPIFKVTFSKGTWNFIDIIVAGLLCIFVLRNKG